MYRWGGVANNEEAAVSVETTIMPGPMKNGQRICGPTRQWVYFFVGCLWCRCGSGLSHESLARTLLNEGWTWTRAFKKPKIIAQDPKPRV